MSLGRNPKVFARCTLAGDDKVLDLIRFELVCLVCPVGVGQVSHSSIQLEIRAAKQCGFASSAELFFFSMMSVMESSYGIVLALAAFTGIVSFFLFMPPREDQQRINESEGIFMERPFHHTRFLQLCASYRWGNTVMVTRSCCVVL